MLIGEAPGAEENDRGKPFVGPAGYHLDLMFGECGINRADIRISNAFRYQPYNNNISQFVTFIKTHGQREGWPTFMNGYVKPNMIQHLHDLHDEVERVQPNCIVAMGRTAYWALTGEPPKKNHMLSDLRGNIFYPKIRDRHYKVIPTFHSSYIMQYAWQDRSIVKHDLSRALHESLSSELIHRPAKFYLQPTYEQTMSFLDEMFLRSERGEFVTLDLETRGGQIACCGIGTQERVLTIPFMVIEGDHSYWPPEVELSIVLRLREISTHPNARIRGQNLLYDCQYTAKIWGFVPRVRHDTIINHHCLWPNPNMRNRLEFQGTLYCQQPRFWKVEGKEWDSSMSETQLWNYNAEDVSRTDEIGKTLEDITKQVGLTEQNQFLQDLFEPVLFMMLRGVRIDLERKDRLLKEFRVHTATLKEEIDFICSHPLNPNSPQQLQTFFYNDLGIRPVTTKVKEADGSRRTRLTVNDEALEKIKEREPLVRSLIERIQIYRSAKTITANVLVKDIAEDGRARCSYRIDGTKTFRFSAKEDAFGFGFQLMNISEGEDKEAKPMARGLPNLRDMFIPDEDCEFIEGDLEGADARVVAWEANDPWLKALFREGIDIHEETGRELKLSRPLSKRARHAGHYGVTAEGLANRIGRTVHEADLLLRKIFEMSPAIGPVTRKGSWHWKIAQVCAEGNRTQIGILENIFGFRYPVLERGFYTHGLAWVPQSTIAILTNKILLNVWRQLRQEVQLMLQVHDSLLMQARIEQVDEVLPKITAASQIVLPYPDDPLIIPFSLKRSKLSWGECKE
jgi:DNA polymerase I-like protein with 3'-5' exonuclease and polymerase domains/uracil-DNA glycosylase